MVPVAAVAHEMTMTVGPSIQLELWEWNKITKNTVSRTFVYGPVPFTILGMANAPCPGISTPPVQYHEGTLTRDCFYSYEHVVFEDANKRITESLQHYNHIGKIDTNL